MNRKKVLIPVIIFTVIIVILIIVLNPSSKYNKLSISESNWNDIKQSRIENKNLVLEEIRFNDYKLIIDENNNTLYYSLVHDSQNNYNPNVNYSTNNKNAKLAVLEDEITSEKVRSNHQFKIMIYDEEEEDDDFVVKDDEINENNIPMEIYLFDNLSNIPNKITISSGKVKIKDNNYVFSLHMLTPGKNKRDNKISILNMKPNSEFVLSKVNEISDSSQKQEEKVNIENKKHRVELFLNNEYQGVYSLSNIDEKAKNVINFN